MKKKRVEVMPGLKNAGIVSDKRIRTNSKTLPPAIKDLPKQDQQIYNSLSGLLDSISMGTPFFTQQISDVDTLFQNNRWLMISNMRQLLSQIYVEHGIVQTLIDQPVDDGFRAGYQITSKQLDEDNIQELMRDNESSSSDITISQAVKWNRLFGGAGIVIITGQDPARPLAPLKENDLLNFRAADLWELFYNKQNYQDDYGMGNFEIDTSQPGFFFNYYGIPLHPSRVIMLRGKEPPSFIRPRLRGWGMSELERLVRSLNSYLKNQDLVFEMLDEAKVDLYKIENLNASLISDVGTRKVQERIQLSNMLKNFQNALVMDKNDEWDQKQITFSGLAEIYTMLKQGIAADLKMPITKLFGVSSAGFNSGEDDIENYNSMVEGEVRAKAKALIIKVNQIKCQKLFGFVPDDLEIKFPPLRILSAKEEEEVKNSKANRITMFFNAGLISPQEAKESINKDNLLGIKIDEGEEIFDNPRMPGYDQIGTGGQG